MRLALRAMHGLGFLMVAMAVPAISRAATIGALSCQSIVLPMDDGAKYNGLIRNEDYRFSAIIPPGKTGWGVRAPAPFHGFTIFLDGDGRYREGDSCINLYVGVQVALPEDDSEKPLDRTVKKPLSVGNRNGFQTIEGETLGGRAFRVVTVHINLHRLSGEADYVSLMLISPKDKYAANRKIFDSFLSNLKFW